MGLAASQARLLTLTARLADNELRSQTINNAKMRLATQSSQASENYINALNNATLKFANYDETGNAMSQDLTYNALTAYSSYNTQYGLVNSAGQILVSEQEAKMFTQANGNLNAYLLAHGLEYTTTYFNELGAIKNDAYPTPFNNISVADMKKYYEQYGSYENSVEVENYQNNYTEYIKATNTLVKASSAFLDTYLKANTNNDEIVQDASGNISMKSLENDNNLASLVQKFKNAFTKNSNNYNIETLYNNGLISEAVKNELTNRINAYSYENGNVKYTEDTALSIPRDADENGNRVYTLDNGVEVTVGADGYVSIVNYDKASEFYSNTAAEGSSCTFTLTYPKDITGNPKKLTLKDFVNQMSYTLSGNENGEDYNVTKYFKLDGDNTEENPYKLTTSAYITDPSTVREMMNSTTDEIFNLIVSSANYENFAELLYQMNSTNTLPNGIDLTKDIEGLNKNLGEVLADYTSSKYNFLTNIFNADSSKIVEEDLKNGAEAFKDEDGNPVTVTPENLTNIDFVLQYLRAKGLTQSASFDTVIKEYLVEQIVEVYGEPKYAWVDNNDAGNTGNADAKAQWYTNLFNRMNQGFKALENGLASSKEWIEYALESGIVSLEQVDKNFKWNGLSYKTCIKITEETDEAAVTKAEAEYNRAMNDIEAKDNIFDIELKNIDTEHSALQTEYDSIKGVIDKNISRTFKFNQNA